MREFLVFQSLWAMQDHRGQCDLPLEAQLEKIAAAGFDGITDHFWKASQAARLSAAAKAQGLQIEGQVFPRTVDDLAAALDVVSRYGCHHLTLQADVRPRTLTQAIELIEGWQRLAEQVDFPILLETHRYRLTSDLLFTLDILAKCPTSNCWPTCPTTSWAGNCLSRPLPKTTNRSTPSCAIVGAFTVGSPTANRSRCP